MEWRDGFGRQLFDELFEVIDLLKRIGEREIFHRDECTESSDAIAVAGLFSPVSLVKFVQRWLKGPARVTKRR